jgi:hypothetical protein
MGQLEVFPTQWRRIEAVTSEPGPFIWRVWRPAMTLIALDKHALAKAHYAYLASDGSGTV